jgi:MFS family permease
MSAYILVAISGGSLGLLAGGVLTEAVSWRWIFIINLPIGAATIVLGKVLIAEDAIAGGRRRIDIGGSLFVTAAVLLGTYAIIEAPTYGWGALRTIGTGAAAIALLGVFVAWEARVANPIMPFRILRLRSLCSSSLVRAFVASGMFAIFFLGALYLEHVLGYSPLRTGLAFMPLTVGVAVMSSGVTSRLMNRFGPLAVMLAGMAAVIAGLLLVARAGAHASYWPDLFPAFLVFGVGGGATFTPLLSIAMADVPSEDAGLASGIVNVSMQLGAAIGLALLGTIAADRTAAVAAGRSQASALLSGYDLAFVVAAGGVAFAMVAAGVLLAGASRRLQASRPTLAGETDDPTGASEIGVVIEI